jgi:hypothetical protein
VTLPLFNCAFAPGLEKLPALESKENPPPDPEIALDETVTVRE